MKILFDTRVLTHKIYTGVENYTKNIVENMRERLDLNIVQPKTTNRYLAHLWTHFILPFKKGEILFCPANIAPIFVPNSKKLVVTIHDISFNIYPKSFSNFFRLYYKIIVPINIKRADKIITISNHSQKEIEKYYPNSKGKIEVIYLGFNNIFKQFNVKKKKEILYVGSINERKNFVNLLKAFNKLSIDNYKLIVVGNYSSNFIIDIDSKEVLNNSKNNKEIIFKENIDNKELVELYNSSSLFVFPSFYEGFGLPILEAMACGTPVISSNSSSMPEVGGDAVIYCNPNSIDDIRDKIEMVLGDKALQEKLISKGLERVKKFSWEKSANEHIRVFESLI